ncbi:MAG TPA: DUF4401 domain-containing protein [Psychrobacter sp.]|uniref:DUF4401 domain-containing protein n=1 Tax=Psychrobacter sp. TaxID=56811 RepID=UPI002CF19A15|nr:DUF4401 domain-containing protein [Psychrobacter sp.]HSP85274.1 DUF4401 domain-containing protein [Psychrobacter sp.]
MNNDKQTLLKLKKLGLIHEDFIAESSANSSFARADMDGHTLNNHNLEDDNPWFIQVFFGFSGFVASLFFIGFLTLMLQNTGALESTIATFLIGMLLNVGSFILFKSQTTRRSMFLNSLAFTLSVAGQAYVMYALVSGDIEHPLGVWLFLFIQSALTFIVPNFMYRLLSSLVALGCTVYLLNDYQLPELSLGLLALIAIISHLQRYRLLQHAPVKWRAGAFDSIKAIGYASAMMLLGVSVYFIAAEYRGSFNNDSEAFRYNYYLAQSLLTLASFYAAYLILKRYHPKPFSSVSIVISSIVFGIILLLGILSLYVSGLLATSLIIIIAVANNQRLLLGLGITALVSYIFWYYYQLDTSLLVKSASMLLIGIALLLIRWLLIKGYLAKIKPSANDNQERLP